MSALISIGFCANADDVDLFDVGIGDLLSVQVNTAAKKDQSIVEAPAVISVISRDDIKRWGYRSIGEAVSQVPGFYGIYDFMSYNHGVRGINGGLRAYSRILKVMINGNPINFSTSSANFLGPELLPISIVESIEIIRGPASALYGADAYLGVVNIKVKDDGNNVAVSGHYANIDGKHGKQLSLTAHHEMEGWHFTGGLSASSIDESGHALPGSSPDYSLYSDTESKNDVNRPRNLFGQMRYVTLDQEFEAQFLHSVLDSKAEFLDFGTLTHDNRFALEQSHLNLNHTYRLSDVSSLQSSLSYSMGSPHSNERLNFGSSNSVPVRDFEFNALRGSIEIHHQFSETGELIAGTDYWHDDEDLISISNYLPQSGDTTLISPSLGQRTLINRGYYLQYGWLPLEDFQVTSNVRLDEHSIYGSEFNYRLASVYHYDESLTLKLLLGSSYKAPTVQQLFTQPLFAGEVIGNAELQPESADTIELSVNKKVDEHWAVLMNLFKTKVVDKIELVESGHNLTPRNLGEQDSVGFESEVLFRQGNWFVKGSLAYQDTKSDIARPFQSNSVTHSESFPKWSGSLALEYNLEDMGKLAVRMEHASQRRATKSNILENLFTPYQLDSYQLWHLNWSIDWNSHMLNLGVNNLTDEDFAEPGYNGVDIPGRKRQLNVGYTYEF